MMDEVLTQPNPDNRVNSFLFNSICHFTLGTPEGFIKTSITICSNYSTTVSCHVEKFQRKHLYFWNFPPSLMRSLPPLPVYYEFLLGFSFSEWSPVMTSGQCPSFPTMYLLLFLNIYALSWLKYESNLSHYFHK
jgi:hypothetical protein